MDDMKKQASRDVLKKLIAMCQQMMMDGMGDSEKAGADLKDKLGDAMAEGSDHEESLETPVEEAMETEDDGDETPGSLQDHIKAEMKKGKRSPLSSGRKVAIMVAGPAKTASKGRY